MNFAYATPIPLNTTFALEPVVKEFVSITVTPFIQDEFLFIGFDAKSNVHPMLHSAHALGDAVIQIVIENVETGSFWGKLFKGAKAFLA